MNKIFITLSCICTTCFCQLPYKVLDPLEDPNLSVAAKALYLCIMSQDEILDRGEYLESLTEEDVFYEPIMELVNNGYLR